MTMPLRDDAPTSTVPWVNWALIALNVVVFLCLQPAFMQGGHSPTGRTEDAARSEEFLYRWAGVPCELVSGHALVDRPHRCESAADPSELPGGRFPHKNVWLAALTLMFLHANLAHIAGNMLFLWIFGNNVEDRLGHWRYLALYLATGLAATLAHTLANPASAVPMLGASGAIAGVMGAYFILHGSNKVLTVVPAPVFMVAYLPAWALLSTTFVLQFFTPSADGVAWMAHVGGMVAGAMICVFAPPPDRRSSNVRPLSSVRA